jgi:hypothetical protein
VLDQLTRNIGDGHVDIRWPTHTPSDQSVRADCAALGYDEHMFGKPVAALVPGYRPVQGTKAMEFPTGIIKVSGHTVGVIQIGIFTPQGIPMLCSAALASLNIESTDTCDEACTQRIETWASNRMSSDLAEQIRTVKSAGAEILLIDIANNGGGTEWAEAAARTVTAVPLQSERLGYVQVTSLIVLAE